MGNLLDATCLMTIAKAQKLAGQLNRDPEDEWSYVVEYVTFENGKSTWSVNPLFGWPTGYCRDCKGRLPMNQDETICGWCLKPIPKMARIGVKDETGHLVGYF